MLEIKRHLHSVVSSAAERLGYLDLSFDITEPARPEFGDFATNAALIGAKAASMNPRAFADTLVKEIEGAKDLNIESISVAGPGFINFKLNRKWLHDEVRLAINLGEEGYGRVDVGKGAKLLLEFVSANPTGPLHLGNGWWASYGDSLGRLLRFVNYHVSTEYYVNDTGGQIRALGSSIVALRKGEDVPEGGYSGAYVADLAKSYDGSDDVTEAGRWAAERILVFIKDSLSKLEIEFDNWYSQASIEESGLVAEVISVMEGAGVIDIIDGKKVFRATDFGDTRDRYLTKENGDFTYLAGDIAYHYNKLVMRGFDYAIDIFGADHQGQVPSLKGAMVALGVASERLEILLGQMVSLVRDDEVVKFSKRKGNVVDLGEVTDEIGSSAMRLLSLSTSIDRATTVDLESVRSKSMDNPVYYIQYAHARMAAVERMRIERGIDDPSLEKVDLGLLEHPREIELLKVMARLDETIEFAARERAPYKIVGWLKEFASAFHGFYHDCSILGATSEIAAVRILLVRSCQVALRVGLALVGVTAPEQM
ncbi:MAG: arginine--tRNA ligase [Actinomycetota bacterium]|nr:arginine--tRNA ligase [Actinomycetota bacterium]